MDAQSQEAWDLDTDEIRSIDSDELHETRPNRWRGPRSTWEEFTKEERLLHRSLEQTRNQDLAVHLYNAFALKRPAKTPQGPPVTASSSQPPVPSQLTLEDLYSPGDWRPPVRWTSWPLHISRVPNEELLRVTHDEHDEFTTRKKESEMPSMKLEEEVTAAILRAAKERFQSRDLAPDEDDNDMVSEEGSQPDDLSDREESPIVVKRDPSYFSDGDDETEAADEPSLQDPQAAVVEDADYRPVVSADDDLSHDILRPSVRHILAQMDATLHTLHHARVAGLLTFDKRDESESDGSSEDSETRGKSRKRKGKAKPQASDVSDDDSSADKSDDADHESTRDDGSAKEDRRRRKPRGQGDTSPEASRSRQPKDRSRRFDKGERVGRWGLRDWRDVLGAASISGFDKDVVERAAQRCADLFGQSMEFHTMVEGKASHTTTVCQPGGQMPAVVVDTSEEEEQHLEEERRRKRLKADIERRQREKRAKRSQTRSAAVSDDEGFKTADEELSQSRAVSEVNDDSDDQPLVAIDINTVEASPDGLFYCPIPYCKRHQKGFPAKRGLREHYRLTHDQPTAVRGTFYCPFVECKYHTRSFKARKNLRAHVRKMHPQQVPGEGDRMDIDMEDRRTEVPVIEIPGSEDEMDGDVHVDGFLKPIKIRKGWLTRGGREKGQLNRRSSTTAS